MGYHTEFRGALKFTAELTTPRLVSINQLLGEDCRNHPEWEASHLAYIDLKLLEDCNGLTWDGSECTYHMPELVNVVIREMQKLYPDFGLSGVITAQGSAVGDIWELYINEDGLARKRELMITSESNTCPHCSGTIKENTVKIEFDNDEINALVESPDALEELAAYHALCEIKAAAINDEPVRQNSVKYHRERREQLKVEAVRLKLKRADLLDEE